MGGRRGRPRTPGLLTPREREVVELVAADLTNVEIAERLEISLAGVKYHLNQVYAKTGLSSRPELIAWHRGEGRLRRLAAAPVAALFSSGREAIQIGATSTLGPSAGVAVIAAVAGVAAMVSAGAVWLFAAGPGTGQAGQPVLRVDWSELEEASSMPWCDYERKVCITELPEGEYRALHLVTAHPVFGPRGCTATWRPGAEYASRFNLVDAPGVFREPCGGATFDIRGDLIFGPALRGLDRYPIIETETHLLVSLDEMSPGPTKPPHPGTPTRAR